MDYIVANIDTVLKRTTDQSSALSAADKLAVKAGTRIDILKWADAENFHYKVFISTSNPHGIGAGWWHLFDSNEKPEWDHWALSWLNESNEKDEPFLDVVSSTPVISVLGEDTKPDSPFNSRLTAHITYGEFCLYQEERRFYEQYQLETALVIANFLELVRFEFGNKPLKITSGYRPPRINKKVGGASSSEHLFNAPEVGAVDFRINGVDTFEVQDWCDVKWPYSLGYGAKKGFVHLGVRRGKPKVRWVY